MNKKGTSKSKRGRSAPREPTVAAQTGVTRSWYSLPAIWILGVVSAVLAWFATAPNVYVINSKPNVGERYADEVASGEVGLRTSVSIQVRNLSLRGAVVRAELVPKGVTVIPLEGKREIRPFSDDFEVSRTVLNITNSQIPPLAATDIGADIQLRLRLISQRAVYVYRLRWIVEGQGEILHSCIRFATLKNGIPKIEKSDFGDIPC